MENKEEIIKLVDEYVGYKTEMDNTSRKIKNFLPFSFCDSSTMYKVQVLSDAFDNLATIMGVPIAINHDMAEQYFDYKGIRFFAILPKKEN